MDFPTTLLAPFSESHQGTQDPEDGNLHVPRILSPTIEIPESVRQMNDQGVASADPTVYTTSVFKSFAGVLTNGAQTLTDFLVISSGIWDITWNATLWTNKAAVGGFAGGLFMYDNNTPILKSVKLVQLNSVGAGGISQVTGNNFRVAIPRGFTHTFRADQEVMGAGETIISFYTVFANRLG